MTNTCTINGAAWGIVRNIRIIMSISGFLRSTSVATAFPNPFQGATRREWPR